jgi:hypothetical protein
LRGREEKRGRERIIMDSDVLMKGMVACAAGHFSQ